MPGRPEFLQQVGGSNGESLQTNASGTVETNNYREGDGFDFGGGSFPYEVNPPETIEEFGITISAKVTATITTESGTTITVPLNGTNTVWDHLSIESVEFTDPKGTAARIAGWWAGE
jgi:hypothetical protein